MEEYELQFLSFLQQRGLKLTSSRREILNMVFRMHEHFNAEELYNRLKATTRGISLATVYRTIPLMVESGLVQQAVRVSGRERYEHIFGHPRHIHWLCRNCGALLESDLTTLSPEVEKQAQGLRFTPEKISISITGLCWKCQAIENENHINEN